MISKSQIGERGVLLTIEELLAHNLKPYRPVVDDHGVDLMLSSGIRIQVKTSNLSTHNRVRSEKVYQFSCSKNVPGEGVRAGGISSERRVFAGQCDYLVLVGLNERRFWIIPASVVDAQKCTALILGPRPLPNTSDVMTLVEQGKGLEEIAKELDCCVTTVWSRKTYGDIKKGKIIGNIRSFENRWDLLTGDIVSVPVVNIPVIHERDPDFVATLAGPVAA